MITTIIALLMGLGLIDSAEHYHSLSDQEQTELQEIIITDIDEY